MARNTRQMSFSDASAGSCRIKSKGHIVGHTLWRGWAATCVFLKLERFKEKKAVSNFPELIEQIKGNFARCHYFFILCIMGWGLVSKSSSSRGFQDIEMRLPKLFNTNLAVKMMEFWWYCLSKANRQRSDFLLLNWVLISKHMKTTTALQIGLPFFQISVDHFKHLWQIS